MSKKGELNAQSFYCLLSYYKTFESRRFDATDFTPTYRELLELIVTVNKSGQILVNKELSAKRCADNVISIINHLGTLSDLQQHLYGQEFLVGADKKSVDALLSIFTHELNDYYIKHDVLYVINTASFKPEFGLVREESETKYLIKSHENTAVSINIKLKAEL